MGELQPERLHLAAEAELLGLRQQRRDLVGAHAGLDAGQPAVHPLAGLRVGVPLRRGRAAHRERAVVAGPVAVERVDDVEERLVAGADEPVGEVVRVRVAPLTGDRVDRLDLVGAHLVEALVGVRDDLVLAHPGLQHLDDVLVDAVDHRRRLVEQDDLVGRLDHPGVEHELLAVDDRQALPLHLEQERRLDDVDAHGLVGHARLDEQRLDLRHRVGHQPDRRRDGAAEAEEAGPVVLGRHPLGVLLVVLDRRAEVPQHRVLAAGQQGVADHLVAEGAADPGLRRVADVVEVEQQEGAALAGLQRLPWPGRAGSRAGGRSRPAARSRRPCARAPAAAQRSSRSAPPRQRRRARRRPRRPRGTSSRPELRACSSSRTRSPPSCGRCATLACTVSRAAAVTGIGTPSSSAAREAEVEVLAQQHRRERRA